MLDTLLMVAVEPDVSPKRTVRPDWNPVPVIVTREPPAVGPLVGLIPVTVGATMLACTSNAP